MKNRLIIFFALIFIFTLISCKKPNNDDNHNGDNFCIHENKTWITIKDSTCTLKGTKEQVCDDCKEVLTTAYVPLKNHELTLINGYDATCIEDGLTNGSKCKNCDYVEKAQEIIPKYGHTYELDEEKSTSENLVYSCFCGDSYEIKNDNGTECTKHVDGDWEVLYDSTCDKLGEKRISCKNCGVVLRVESIEMKNHLEKIIDKVEPTCNETGLTEGVVCEVCNKIIVEQEIIEKLEHSYKIIETLNPSAYEKGYIKYQCELCSHTYSEELDALGSYNPTKPVTILLDNSNITVTNNNGGVNVSNNIINITLSGEYDILGSIDECSITITLKDDERATLNLLGVTIKSSLNNPIYIESGDEVDISVKSGTINYIYDLREAKDADSVGGAIYSKVDLDIKGKGYLEIESKYNNGIATTKDLKIKNVELKVNVPNNAIKGNDSVTIESGTLNLISSSGDCIKTENTDISDNDNQRGIITIIDGTLNLYAACDAIDASYDVVIDGGTINIYTEKYSDYTGDVEISSSTDIYLRISSRTSISTSYKYSAMFVFEDGSSSFVSGIRDTNPQSRYYKFNVLSGAKYVKFFVYNSTQADNQSVNYVYCSDQLTIPSSYDTYYVTTTSSSKINGSWTNYSIGNMGPGGNRPGGMGPGGMQEGNPESSLYSCKGIKADNSVTINGGIIKIFSHDDAIHANSDVTLASGSNGSGNVTINGGEIEITTEDDGLHADGILIINGGKVVINKAYEGVEGNNIYFKNGETSIKSSDDAINAKTTLYFQGGIVYLDAGGDGIDSNGSIYMSGGIVLATGPTNGGNGVIDIGDRGYTFSFTGGLLLAIGCSGMDVSPTGTSGNTVNASRTTSTLNSYLVIKSNGNIIAVMKVTKSNQTYRVFAYNNESYPSCQVSSSNSVDVELENGLYYVNYN